MTTHGKRIPSLQVLRATFLSWAAVVIILQTLWGCKSTSVSTEARSQEQREDLRAIVNTAKIFDCKIAAQEWYIPGDVQQAQIVNQRSGWALIYQALLRGGPRTVYQTLAPGLSFLGDGYVVGPKNMPHVSDFETFEDSLGHMWTFSRIKAPETELFKGLVEVNIEQKTWRTILPTPHNETVQQIWPVLPTGNAMSSVIVRTTRIEESAESQLNDENTFYWYQVGKSENSTRLMGTFRSGQIGIQPSSFVTMEKTSEPVAIAVVQSRNPNDSFESTKNSYSSQISLFRMFSKTTQEKVLFSGKGSLSALYASQPNQTGIHIAWIFSPERGSTKFLQTTSIQSSMILQRFFKKGPIREQESILATEIAYEANAPEFLFTKMKNQTVPVLAWWGKIEDDVAVILQHIFTDFRHGLNSILRSPDGSAVGLAFKPTLAFIPPKKFSRVLDIRAAQNDYEKYIMVLSNRSESADLQKESLLYPCLF